MTSSEKDINALKKILLENEDIHNKLLMHYRVIKKQNDSEDFYQDKSKYNNKYEFDGAINIKSKYFEKTLSNNDIQNTLQSRITDTLDSYNTLINNALNELIDYLTSNNISESDVNRIINNYNNDKMYISLDARIPVNDMHYIDENLLFSNKDKNMIDEKLSPQYIKEEYLNNENN